MRVDAITGCDGGARIIRALRAQARAAGLALHLDDMIARDWASVTFSGTQHRLAITVHGDAAAIAAWAAALPEVEWSIPGIIVINVSVERVARENDVTRLSLTLLTLFAE